MEKSTKRTLAALFVAVLMVFFCTIAAASESEMLEEPVEGVTLTVIGTVNDLFQVVTDNGEKYDIGEGETGDSLLQNVGRKVKVVGILLEEAGMKTIDVLSYSVLEE